MDLPGPGLEPVSPALAGGFLTTVPPGKPHLISFICKALLVIMLNATDQVINILVDYWCHALPLIVTICLADCIGGSLQQATCGTVEGNL